MLWPHDADRSEGAAGGEATGESFVRREEFGVEFKGAGTAAGRGKGGGRAEADGARYYELNSEKAASVRFWKSLGFVENGVDEYGMPLFIRKA